MKAIILFFRKLAWSSAALLALFVAGVALRCFSFRWIAATLRKPVHPRARDTERLAKTIYWAIGSACRRLPWTATCLTQAIAANLLLRVLRVPSILVLGVDPKRGENFQAHAWLEVGDFVVTGGEQKRQFAPILSLSNLPR